MGIYICLTDGHSFGVARKGEFTAAFKRVSYEGENDAHLFVTDEQNVERELFITKNDAEEILRKGLRDKEKVSVSFEENGCCNEHASSKATALERYSKHEFEMSFYTYRQLPAHEISGESGRVVALRGRISSDQVVNHEMSGATVDVILPAEEREAFIKALSALTGEKGACRTVSMTTGFNSMTEIKPGVFRVDAPEAERVIFKHEIKETPSKGFGF